MWVLAVFIYYNQAMTSIVIPNFDTRDLCLSAGKEIVSGTFKEQGWGWAHMQYSCVRTNNQKRG